MGGWTLVLRIHCNYLLMRKDDFKEVFVFSLLSEGKMFGMLLVYPQRTSGVVNPTLVLSVMAKTLSAMMFVKKKCI